MLRTLFRSLPATAGGSNALAVGGLIVANLVFNVLANGSFKLSAASGTWRGFLTWQVVGNLAGLITVLTFTGLLRYIPLAVAFPVTIGLAVVGVQFFAAAWYFKEDITNAQWLGTLLVAAGIFLIGRK
jgi:multidrug transporter EmrE-like cation transporter